MTPVLQDTLPDDPATLRAMLLEVARERDAALQQSEKFRSELVMTKIELDIALHELKARAKELFGPSTERLTDEELPLFMEAAAEVQAQSATEDAAQADEIVVPEHRRRRPGSGRTKLPDHLPREVVVHDVPEAEKTCACCGKPKILIDRARREVLEYVPAIVKVIVHERPVYCCGSCRSISKMPAIGATLPIPKSIAGPGLLAAVIVGKYADHLPLYRMEGILPRFGIEISRQTMCGWLAPCADLLAPLAELMRQEVLRSRVIQSDDTPVNVLDPGLGRSRQGRFWSYLGDHARRYAVFEFTSSREGKWPQRWLKDYEGYLQSDAFAGYSALHETGRVIEVGCWAHARRKFYDARDLSVAFCGDVLKRIRKLYAVESEATAAAMDADARRALRNDRSGAELESLMELLETNRSKHVPKSPVRQAIEYVLARRTAFERYLEDGALQIDNNACERSLRAIAIGRKNWLFAGSNFGGERAATFFTVLCSARLHELEPWAYLSEALMRLAVHRAASTLTDETLRPLLPDQWRAAHPTAIVPLGR